MKSPMGRGDWLVVAAFAAFVLIVFWALCGLIAAGAFARALGW